MNTEHTVGVIIQHAVAPVFLIAGLGAILNVLTSRLARVVDRERQLERELTNLPAGEHREEKLGSPQCTGPTHGYDPPLPLQWRPLLHCWCVK